MVDFAEILDRCVADIQQGRATLASCQARYPQYAEQLAALLPIARRLTARPSASLPIDKRRAIQAQLLKRAAERQGERLRRRGSQPAHSVRWLPAAVALMMILGLAGWGVTSISIARLPGDTLYPIKRLSEQVAVALAPAAGQPDLHVTLAQRRLDEYASLAARGRPEPALIVEAATEIGTALSQIESSGAAVPQASVEQVALLAETQLQALSERAAGLSIDQQQEIQSAQTLFVANLERMAELAKTRPAATPLDQVTPTSTAAVTPQPTGTDSATPLPATASTVSATRSVITPTGLVNTPKPKVTPPGLVKTPKPQDPPPGQGKPPQDPPPGQEKPPQDPKPPKK